MKMTKKEILKKIRVLEKIEEWNERVLHIQKKKAELEKEILIIDVQLNTIMTEYDRLCRSLL